MQIMQQKNARKELQRTPCNEGKLSTDQTDQTGNEAAENEPLATNNALCDIATDALLREIAHRELQEFKRNQSSKEGQQLQSSKEGQQCSKDKMQIECKLCHCNRCIIKGNRA